MTPTMYLVACVSLVCPLSFPSGRSLMDCMLKGCTGFHPKAAAFLGGRLR